MTTTAPAASSVQSEPPEELGVGESIRAYVARLRGGDVGSLPAVLGLVVLVIIFGAKSSDFLTAANFANLINQGVGVTTIAMGLIFVLLLGEIDLSAGFAAGTCAAVMAWTLTDKGWPWWASILACLLTGVVIGLAIGLVVTRLGIPSSS
jgi:D-xylose transport system permease protein